jgi:AsmA protein
MKWLKRLVLAVVIIVLVFVGAAVVLVLTVDPNDYKSLIVQQVDKATGRKLELAGDIQLSFFPWLGLQLGQAQLSNAKGFGEAPFARVEDVQVRVALLPLFRGEVRADTVRLKGLEVNLAKNKQGVSNWDDLVTASEQEVQEQDTGESQSAPLALAVGGIEIDDAALHWQDAQSGADVRIAPFNLSTGTLRLGEPFDLEMDLKAVNKAPELTAQIRLRTEVTLDLDTQRYRLKDLSLEVEAKGEPLPGGAADAALATSVDADLKAQTLTLRPLSLEAYSLVLEGHLGVEKLLDAPTLTGELESEPFSPKALLAALGQPPIETADPKALDQARLALAFSADADNATISQLNAVLDDTHLDGKAAVHSFEKPRISFALKVDEIDTDRYLPPKPPAAQTTQPAAGPGQAPGAPEQPLALPVEALRGLDMDGSAQIGKLKVANLRLADVRATLKARDGLLSLRPVSTALYGGAVDAGLSMDVRKAAPAFAVASDLKAVQIGDLMADLQQDKAYLSGTGAVSFDLKTHGDRISALKRQLGGTARLAVTKGALRDPELAKKVEAVIAFLKGREPRPVGEAIVFDSLTGSAVIQQGVLRNDDLKLLTPLIQAKGAGSADLGEEQVDYTLSLALAGGGQAKKHTFVPITIKGPFDDLHYGLDLKAAAKERVEKEVEKHRDKAEEKIKERGLELEQKLQDKLKGKLKLF